MHVGIPTPKYAPTMLAMTNMSEKFVKFKMKIAERKTPASTQYLRNTNRSFNLLVHNEAKKADKTKLTKLAPVISNSELLSNCELVTACK